MKKKKQKKTDAAGKYTLPAAGPGWEPSLPDPEQPPQVQRLPYRPDPEQPPRVQRLPYRPDPARPPQVQLLQMQRSALPYVGRAGKNSGAANWVEKLDWKTPSGASYTSAPEQGGPSNLVELIMAQRGGGGGGFSPGAGAGRGDAPAPGTGVGGGFAGGGGGLWAGDEHAEQAWGDKALRWLDDNLFRPAGYLAEKYAGGAGKQAETLWNGMVTWGRAGAAGELQQDQLAAQQFAFLGGPWETHAQETEKANTAVTQALPQAAQGLRGDAMRDYAEGIDGRYGDPDGLLGWLGERADSAGQGLLSGAARILGVPGAGTAMDFLSTMENAAQQARENGAGEDEAFLYGLGEVVKRIGGQQLEEYFRSKAGELFTRGEVQAMSPREISENYDAIRESMGLWDKDGRLPENTPGSDVIDSESPMGDNEENGISGQSSGLPQGSGHNEKPMVDTPFGDAGYLKPNVRYQAGEFDYFYETDEQGRICNWNTEDLQLTFREERLPHNSKSPGKKQGDHAGHLVGDRFGGSPDLDNIVSQAKEVNLSAYRKIENEWASAIRRGETVTVNMDIEYEGSSTRPKAFVVTYAIDGEKVEKRFSND